MIVWGEVALIVWGDIALIYIILSRRRREWLIVAWRKLVVRIAGLLGWQRGIGIVVIEGIGIIVVVALVAHLISELLELL